MFTIKGAAEQIGISASTLRAWERRYGVVEPGRTESGYRIYSAQDVRVLVSMATLVDQGRPPSLAAAEAKRQVLGGDAGSIASSAVVRESAGPDRELIESVVRAAAKLDSSALTQALDEMFSLGSFESVVDTNLLPAMKELGQAWAAGKVSIAGEHLAANAVMRRLAGSYEAAAVARTGPRVLIGLAAGGHHELGLFAFAAAVRRHGINTEYLGADLPIKDWRIAIGAPNVVAVVLAMPTKTDVAPVRRVIRASRTSMPHLLVAVGGAEQDRAPEDVLRLGHQIGDAARLMARELESRSLS